jgi:hypothetical protein
VAFVSKQYSVGGSEPASETLMPSVRLQMSLDSSDIRPLLIEQHDYAPPLFNLLLLLRPLPQWMERRESKNLHLSSLLCVPRNDSSTIFPSTIQHQQDLTYCRKSVLESAWAYVHKVRIRTLYPSAIFDYAIGYLIRLYHHSSRIFLIRN